MCRFSDAGNDQARHTLGGWRRKNATPRGSARWCFAPTALPGQWDAQLHRLEGIALLGLNRVEEGQSALEEALRIARRHQAKAYELRAATTLARLWGEQVRRASARDLLAPVYGWFTEGFDTADLKEAKTLLTELA